LQLFYHDFYVKSIIFGTKINLFHTMNCGCYGHT